MGKAAMRKELALGLAYAVVLCAGIALKSLILNDVFSDQRRAYILDTDSARSALVARNLADGKGYRTPLLPEAMTAYYAAAGQRLEAGTWLNSDRFPFTSYAVAALYKLLGSRSPMVGIIGYGFLFFVASGALVYLCAWRLTGNVMASLLAVTFFCNAPEVLDLARDKGADDVFLVILVTYAYLRFRDAMRSRGSWRSVVVGLLMSLTFLSRMNVGVFFLLTVVADLCWPPRRNRLLAWSTVSSVLAVGLGFGLGILPFGIATVRDWGIPFFSANSLYQFTLGTRYSMYSDAWWKAHGVIGQHTLGSLLRADPGIFLGRAAKFAIKNSFEFTKQYGLLLAGFLLSAVSRFRSRSIEPLWPLLIVIAGQGLLNTLSLGFFIDGTSALFYFIFLIPLIAVGAADGIYQTYRFAPARFPLSGVFARARRIYSRCVAPSTPRGPLLIAAAVGATILALAIDSRGLAARLLNDKASVTWPTVLGVATVVGVVAFLFVKRCRPRTAELTLVTAVCLLVSLGLVKANQPRRFNANLVTPGDDAGLEAARRATSANGIVLSLNAFYTLPWLIERPAMGVPEYVDYVYDLIVKYQYPVEAIHLDGAMNWYLDNLWGSWAPSYEIFPTLARLRQDFPGFELIYSNRYERSYPEFNIPSVQREVALYRRIKGFNFASLLTTTRSISAARSGDRFRFASGFGERGTLDGRIVIVGTDETRNHFARHARTRIVPVADHDLTFRVLPPEWPDRATLRAYVSMATELNFYLNTDLDQYDTDPERSRRKVRTVRLEPGWRTIELELPRELLRSGLNKIGIRSENFATVALCPLPSRPPCFAPSDPPLPSGYFSEVHPVMIETEPARAEREALARPARTSLFIEKVDFAVAAGGAG